MASFCYSSIFLFLWVHYLIYTTRIHADSGSFSASEWQTESTAEVNRNPCLFRGQFMLHGRSLKIDVCTTCSCRNGTVTCFIESCPSSSSRARCPSDTIHVPEFCCPQCSSTYNERMECSRGSQTILHGEHYLSRSSSGSKCTDCTCDNGTLTCSSIEARCARPELCYTNETVFIEGLCCPQCPNRLYVENTTINQYTSTYGVMSGQSNTIVFGVAVEADETLSSPVIKGPWKLSAWVSRNQNGSGWRYSLVEQVFSTGSAYRTYYGSDDQPMQWSYLRYDMELKDGTCDDYKYFCVRFGTKDTLSPFIKRLTFRTVGNDTSRLIDCVPLGECSDVKNDSNPCSYSRSRFLHNEEVRIDLCTLCTCKNGTMLCNAKKCPSTRCPMNEAISIPGECCPQCPYKLTVEKTFNKFPGFPGFSENASMAAKFPLYVMVNRTSSSWNVKGRHLWKLTAWVSRCENGSGQIYSLVEQVFNKRGASKEYRHQDIIAWKKLKYIFKFNGGTCDDYKYFCVRFDRGDVPQPKYGLNFTFRTVDDDESRLVGCVPLGKCHETIVFPTNVATVSPSSATPLSTVSVPMLSILLFGTVSITCLLIFWRKTRRRSRDHRAPRVRYTKTMKDQAREVDEALKHKEVFHDFVRTTEHLGEGEYGVVFKGLLKVAENGKWVDKEVAVKTTRACNTARKILLSEMKLIAELGEHPNILHLVACCSAAEPFYLVTEFMRYGDLLGFMRTSRETAVDDSLDPIYNVGEIEQLIVARDVAMGMAYIQAKQFYHGDLAARNVLIGDRLSVKISDFGMADDIYTRSYQKQWKEQKIPIKWCSIETIQTGICSSQGDVWSFGILLYEIFTRGDTPYPGVAPRFLVTQLRNGYRMEQPPGCPDDAYDMMSRCWLREPDDRPEFSLIAEQLADMLMERSDYMEFEADNGESYVDTPPLERKESTPINDENKEIEIDQLHTVIIEDDGVQC